MDTWKPNRRRPRAVPEIKALLDIFFDGDGVDVPIELWSQGDPTQEKGHGCAPFAFMAMCHLAQGVIPPAWNLADEGVCRSYLWGCIMAGQVLPLPQPRLHPVMML